MCRLAQLSVEEEFIVLEIGDPEDSALDESREQLELGQRLFRASANFSRRPRVLTTTAMQVQAASEFTHRLLAAAVGFVRVKYHPRNQE